MCTRTHAAQTLSKSRISSVGDPSPLIGRCESHHRAGNAGRAQPNALVCLCIACPDKGITETDQG